MKDGRDILSHIVDLLDERWGWPVVVASQVMHSSAPHILKLDVDVQDFHPPGHISFASRHAPKEPFQSIKIVNKQGEEIDQMLWPDHCVS